jgi:hypothetical protein
MFRKSPAETSESLDAAIVQAQVILQGHPINSPEYIATLDALERLVVLKEKNSKRTISPDTIALIAANLAGIVLILQYERAHIVVSKALGFVTKLKI